jgi:putative nucleotidyltransferase-like protein
MSGFDEVRPPPGRPPDPPSVRLSPAQFALIRACVADDRDVAAAVDEWLAHVDLGQLDETTLELAGFLYRRMVDLDVDHIARANLAWTYRRTWHRNQMLVFRARPLLARIGEVTGRTLVLKGGAMISSAYHNDLGVRSLMDLDVLVDRHYVEPLVDWALEHGWHIVKGFDPEDVYIVHHAIDLVYGKEGAVDLHWALLVQGRNPSRDRELLAKSRPARLGDVPIHVLSPTAQLFHTASHARPLGIRHVVDAISIIVHDGDEIDWSELVDEVIERRSIAYTVRTFDLVEQVRPGIIPAEALGCLSRASRHWSDYCFHGQEMSSRREVVRRFAAEVAGRSRGSGPIEKARVVRAMGRRYRHSAGLSSRDVWSAFLIRGGRGLNQHDQEAPGSD